MARNSDEATGRTRRNYVKLGGALIGSGLLAGCSQGEGESPATTDREGTEPTTEVETASETETTTSERNSYTVSVEPAGDVTFDAVPETWVAENASWADMGVALGLDKPSAVVLTGEYRTWHYEDVPGLSTSKDDMTSLWQDGISKELFYDIDAGVHFIDPNYMINLIPNWEQSDVEEMAQAVGPFCGNTSFSSYPWHEDYPYYDLYEATEKVAEVFQRTDRYEALAGYHETVLGDITDRLPEDRPSIALLSPQSTEPESFAPYPLGDRTAYKHLHDLGIGDEFAGTDVSSFTSERGMIDYEPLLEIDPEVLMFYTDTHRTAEDFRSTFLAFMQEHSTASQLTAVQEGRVYPAGSMYQGPIINFSKTERAAKQLFPDEFGGDEQLYDRQKLADIRAGNI